MAEPTSADVREAAVRLLARREHSARELQVKLRQRGYPEELAAEVLEELAAENLLSEERFAEVFVRVRREQGYGPRRILADLAERGVDAALARPHLDDDEEWHRQAQRQRAKRFGGALPADTAERNRQYRFLNNRGFTAEQIRLALDTPAED